MINANFTLKVFNNEFFESDLRRYEFYDVGKHNGWRQNYNINNQKSF